MKPATNTSGTIYALLIASLGILALAVSTFAVPHIQWGALSIGLIIALLILLPRPVVGIEINLVHTVALGSGILFGPTTAAWTVLAGVLMAFAYRRIRSSPLKPRWLLQAGFALGVQVLPLVIALFSMGWGEGISGLQSPLWPGILGPLVLFPSLQFLLYLGEVIFLARSASDLGEAITAILLVEALPVPFLGIAARLYSTSPAGVLLLLTIIPTALAALMHQAALSHQELLRRNRELAMLDRISRVLRSTLNLDQLLAVIHEQVTRLLEAENFYVALYDPSGDQITYPLAVKYGKRCNWAPRPLEPNRLTDRVIRDGKPILVAPHHLNSLAQAGLPPSVETPQAWAGVPLITSERTIGCLAVFSTSPEVQFSPADLDLLTILSGQVSVAIENAMLYEQTQRRAAQLETLNRIMVLITASLDSRQVLEQVCRSVMQVAGAQRSAVYLLDDDRDRCWLAYSTGFSENFVQRSEQLALASVNRSRCLTTSQPVLISDMRQAALSHDHLLLLDDEHVQAFADFPLATPNGQIGILSVFYDSPHTFSSGEVELVQTLALQAAVAVSNARLYAAADRALARRADQLAILENVGRELAAAIDSPRLFEMILDYAITFTNSAWGELCLYNSLTNMLEVKASRGYPDASRRFPLTEGLSGRAVLTRQPVYADDTRRIAGYVDLTNGASRSQLSIPLIHEDHVLGVLTLESDRLNAYSTNDQAFVNQLATQAAIAVVNAQLYHELQRRLREQSTLYQLGSRLVANPELDSVLQSAARSIEAAMSQASVGTYLWNEQTASYQASFTVNDPQRPTCQLPAEIAERQLGNLRPAFLNTGLLRVLPNDEGAAPLLGTCRDCQGIVFPIVVKRQRLGTVLLHIPQQASLPEEELLLLHAMVAQASISLQNALLFQDITHARDRLSAVLNSVKEGLLMLDSTGHILLVNQSIHPILGVDPHGWIGKLLAELPANLLQAIGYTPQEADAITRSFQQGQILTSPKVVLNLSEPKPERVIERTTLPVWGQGNRAIGWMIVLRDITEETQMSQARELITETLIHDLRSPVSAVLSAVDILDSTLSEDQHADELVEQAVRVARNSASRVLGLIESLLDIARLKAGHMDLQLISFDVSTWATNVLSDFLPQANEVNVILRQDIPPDLPHVQADQSKVNRVLANLLDNALKFTPAGGQVLVSAEVASDDMLSIRVSDTGPGIPEEYRQKIFDRFAQVPGQKGRRRGSGLGLTFCRLAVEAHGGRIWVEPRPGGGSIFIFTLPISRRAAESTTSNSVRVS